VNDTTSDSLSAAPSSARSALRSRVERAVRALDDPPRGDELGDRDLNP